MVLASWLRCRSSCSRDTRSSSRRLAKSTRRATVSASAVHQSSPAPRAPRHLGSLLRMARRLFACTHRSPAAAAVALRGRANFRRGPGQGARFRSGGVHNKIASAQGLQGSRVSAVAHQSCKPLGDVNVRHRSPRVVGRVCPCLTQDVVQLRRPANVHIQKLHVVSMHALRIGHVSERAAGCTDASRAS